MRKAILIVLLVFSLSAAMPRPAAAQCGTPPDCGIFGTAWTWQDVWQTVAKGVWDYLKDQLTGFIQDSLNDFMTQIFQSFDNTEGNFGQWFENFSRGDLIPSFKSMTRQWNTDQIEQARMWSALYDAQIQTDTQWDFQDKEHRIRMELYPNETVCSAGTISGGLTRADRLARAMTEAMDNEFVWIGLNKKFASRVPPGSPVTAAATEAGAFVGTAAAATSAATNVAFLGGGTIPAIEQRVRYYREKFCDPDSNGGKPGCAGAPEEMQNADILPFNTILDRVTIRYDENPDLRYAVQSLAENICYPFPDNPIPRAAIDSPFGHAAMLDKRSRIARRATCSHAIHWMAGKRIPGSKIGDWLASIREQSLMDPVIDISVNPSWNEVMQTFTKARYQQPRYYADMAAETDENLEREKIVLDVFYLMQLRDLYELNERIAAMLASQVATLLDASQNAGNAMQDEKVD